MVGFEVLMVIVGVAAASVAVANSARSVTPYAFLMAKIRAWEARMLSEGKMESLAEAESIQSLVSGLRGSDYEADLEGLPDTAYDLESALSRHLYRTYDDILNLIPVRGVPFLKKFAERLELGNLKLVIQAVAGNADRELATMHLVDGIVFSKERLEIMIKSENMEQLIEQLSETEYYDELSKFIEPGEFEPLEMMRSIEHSYYMSVWKRAEDLGSKNRKVARDLLGREIDLLNVKLLFRLKAGGVGPDVILKNLVPIEGTLKAVLLRMCAQADSIESVKNILSSSPLKSVLVPIFSSAGSDVGELEKMLDESLLDYTKVTSLFKPLTIATPLSYLYGTHAEIRNVRTLARGIEDGISPGDLRRLLLRSARVD